MAGKKGKKEKSVEQGGKWAREREKKILEKTPAAKISLKQKNEEMVESAPGNESQPKGGGTHGKKGLRIGEGKRRIRFISTDSAKREKSAHHGRAKRRKKTHFTRKKKGETTRGLGQSCAGHLVSAHQRELREPP